ncbi:hypothetical protein BJY04DRAFT_214183 [Aspergillus karnatakaensis]|uniref:uncharacterized protein n=1 Tax=Aspergillus karnatakaensis TaxID=1810916 RepID=UPI003CCDE8B7
MACWETLKGLFRSGKSKTKAGDTDRVTLQQVAPAPPATGRHKPQEISRVVEEHLAEENQSFRDESAISCAPESEGKGKKQEARRDEPIETNIEKPLTQEEKNEVTKRINDRSLKNSLWEEAYSRVEDDMGEDKVATVVQLLSEGEMIEVSTDNSQGKFNKRTNERKLEKLQELVSSKLDSIYNARLVVKGIVMRDQVNEIFCTTRMFKDAITAAVSAAPHAALAWGCAAGLSQLLGNALTQTDNAKDGLGITSNVLVRRRVMEATPLISGDPVE